MHSNSSVRSSLHPYTLKISVTKPYFYAFRAGMRIRILFFPAFAFEFFLSSFPSFVDLWVSAREFEREDRRIQDAWMRKVMRREPVPCDPFVNPCQWRKTFLSVNGAPDGGLFFFFVLLFRLFSFVNRSSRFVKFTLFIQMREPSRVRVEVILRVTLVCRAKPPDARQISARLRVSFPRIHTSCIGKQCAYETIWKSGDRGFMSLF